MQHYTRISLVTLVLGLAVSFLTVALAQDELSLAYDMLLDDLDATIEEVTREGSRLRRPRPADPEMKDKKGKKTELFDMVNPFHSKSENSGKVLPYNTEGTHHPTNTHAPEQVGDEDTTGTHHPTKTHPPQAESSEDFDFDDDLVGTHHPTKTNPPQDIDDEESVGTHHPTKTDPPQSVDVTREITKACWKDGETRGAGVLPEKNTKQCPDTKPDRSLGMCYPKCGDKRKGFGPLCWDDCSKMKYTSEGIMFCCETDEICSRLVREVAVQFPQALGTLIYDIISHPDDVGKALRDFRALIGAATQLRLPLCSKVVDNNAEVTNVEFETAEVTSWHDDEVAVEM